MGITEVDIYTYRELYYEHVKPLLKQGADDKMIDIMMQNVFPQYGWTKEKFQAFQIIDLMQRIRGLNCDKIKVTDGQITMNPDDVKNLPMLKCPRRTEENYYRELYKKL